MAAANSVYGRWDDTKGEENIDFLPTILSRFDMIYVVKDVHDPVRDQKLAQYVMNVHTGENETKEDKDELDLETLKKRVLEKCAFTKSVFKLYQLLPIELWTSIEWRSSEKIAKSGKYCIINTNFLKLSLVCFDETKRC